MLSFSYTIALQLRETLNTINRLRTQILNLPLPPKTETKLTWEGTAIRTWATLSIAGLNAPKHEVATILANPKGATGAVTTILGLRSAYDFIHTEWRANPRQISLSAMETLFQFAYPHPNDTRLFTSFEPSLKELLSYLDTQEEHPVVQAAIAHMHILTIPELPDPGLFARLVHYLFLAKYGFDIRGWVTPERIWQTDKETYTRLTETYSHDHTLTQWLEYIAQSMQSNLETTLADITESRFHIEYPTAFWELSDRQKEILKLMAAPDATITNREVHKRFKVSQITASRDLARLTSLGLLYPHGKGRSVYYTKI
jgi:DNA-binding transcriptional ArsR family regulator